ncbi:unnamed protein product [Vicia faba]|uniref:Lon N-terminal domain-containing protein n=1 Tax=Vicia faba TaxID=3906 RepID=A0AAV0YX01_VICFA|nr:unnamed protein product [Vicia faba]
MAESVELPSRLAILPFRNKVLLPGAIIRIRCTSPSSVKLVEQELWQKEEKGMIGILPVHDALEIKAAGSTASQGAGANTLEQSSKLQDGSSDSLKPDTKKQNGVVHWHNRGLLPDHYIYQGEWRNQVEGSHIPLLKTAKISSLEMTMTEMEQIEQDPDYIMLSRQFKEIATELIYVLEQKQKKRWKNQSPFG